MTKNKEQILLVSDTHCTDGKCIHASKWIDKEVWEKIKKNIAEDLEKNYTRDKRGWYVHK